MARSPCATTPTSAPRSCSTPPPEPVARAVTESRSPTLPPFTADIAAALPGPAWLASLRAAAFARFAAGSMPDESAEEWRYSRIADLSLERYRPAPSGRAPEPASGAVVDGLLATLVAAGAVVVEIGPSGDVQVSGSHPAVTVGDCSSDDGAEVPLGDIAGEPDVLASLNLAMAPAPLVVDVAGSGSAPEPLIVVVHRAGGEGTAIFPRLLVRVARAAGAAVVEVVTSADVDALVVPVTELAVGDAARLGYLHVQLLGPHAWQVGLQGSAVGRDATLVSAAISLGGDYARMRLDSALTAPGGTSNLLAVWFADGTAVHDLRTVQDHRAPRATSDLYFKGVVANRSRSVYTGLIRVEKGAHGTNAFQTNRNLVLHSGAHADSVPNLEIEDNDVRCSHASAVGPIDPDQRFYLEARGVPPEAAERLIALGFVDEVLRRLPVPAAVAPLRLAIAAKLDEADVIEQSLTGVVA